jgi:SpoIIAA-like
MVSPDSLRGRAPALDERRKRSIPVIEELSDLPAGVIGFEATGTMRAEDYRDVILPALERAFTAGEVRFVVVIPEFHGMSGGALWQDLTVGIEHFRAWKRIALVTDIEWMSLMTTLFGWMTPGEVRHFPLAQRDEAITWAAS